MMRVVLMHVAFKTSDVCAACWPRLYVIGGMNGAERGSLPTVEVHAPS